MSGMSLTGYTSVKEAAKRIGLTDKRVYQLIDEKQIEATEWGRVYLVSVKSVDAYLKRRKNGTKRKKR